MKDTCADCRFNEGGYCQIYEKTVDSGSSACSDFEER